MIGFNSTLRRFARFGRTHIRYKIPRTADTLATAGPTAKPMRSESVLAGRTTVGNRRGSRPRRLTITWRLKGDGEVGEEGRAPYPHDCPTIVSVLSDKLGDVRLQPHNRCRVGLESTL
jgi:hypothetical protein